MKKKFTFLRHLKMNQAGATLVEVMMSAGLAAVVSLAVMRIGENSNKAIKKIESDSVLRFYIDTVIRRTLSDERYCATTFGSSFVTDATGTNAINRIYNSETASSIVAQTGSQIDLPGYSTGRYWAISAMTYNGFIPQTASANNGTCKFSMTFRRTINAGARIMSFGAQERTMNFDLACKLDGASPPVIQSCVLNNAQSEGMWTKEFTDNFAYINYNDVPNGFVSIGNNGGNPVPDSPLEIFIDKKIPWYDPLYSFGMSIPKDSTYSFSNGYWGFSESGPTLSNSCLNFYAYNNDITNPAVYPYVSLCKDQNYFRGGINILGSLGTLAEPANLEIQNGSLVCTDTNYATTDGTATGSKIPNVYICGNSNSTKDSNSFVSGVTNDVNAGAFSLLLGSLNTMDDDAIASTFYAGNDDVNTIVGVSNYSKATHTFTFGRDNTNNFTNSKMIGSNNKAFETTIGGQTNIGAFSMGHNNQIQGDGLNEYFAVFGRDNFLNTPGFIFGTNNQSNHQYTMMLGRYGETEKDAELVISNSVYNISAPAGIKGQIVFSAGLTGAESFVNGVEFTGTQGINNSTGSLNTGAISTNFRDQSLISRGLSAPTSHSVPTSTVRMDKGNAAIMASINSDVYDDYSVALACNDCLIKDVKRTSTSGFNAIVAGSENTLEAVSNSAILSSYKSRIIKADQISSPANNANGGTFLAAAGESLLTDVGNGGLIGGYNNSIVCNQNNSGGNNCNADVLMSGSNNSIAGTGTTGTFSSIILGGNGNRISDDALTATPDNIASLNSSIIGGLNNEVLDADMSMIAGGIRNSIRNGSTNFICGGNDNKIQDTSSTSITFLNTILGGHNIKINSNTHQNRVFGSQVEIGAGKYGNMVITDYEPPTSTTNKLTVGLNNHFYARFKNGYYLHTNSSSGTGPHGLHPTNYVYYNNTSSSWGSPSSKSIKDNFSEVDLPDIFKAFTSMNIQKWNYKGDNKEVWHIGPFAQDFYADFKVGESDVRIDSFDLASISLLGAKSITHEYQAAISEMKKISLLEKIVNNLMDKINNLVALIESKLFDQESKLSELERKVARIERMDEEKI